MTYATEYRPLTAEPLAARADVILLSPLPDNSSADGGEFLLRLHSAARAFLRLMADELRLQMGSYTISTQEGPQGLSPLSHFDPLWHVSVLRAGGRCLCVGVESGNGPARRVMVWSSWA